MKFIFDFDDVLFHSTKLFKEHMYDSLEKYGVPRKDAKAQYEKMKSNSLGLKELIDHFSTEKSLYEEILNESENFVNEELINTIKKIGENNCYIVSHGSDEFQRDKIKRAGIEALFSKIIIVQGSKKEAVEKIAAKHKDEEVVFVDDKAKHFEDLDLKKYPNVTTI